MFKVDPEEVYTIKEVAAMSDGCIGTVYNMIKRGLVAVNGPQGKMITGRSLLAYFNGETKKPEIKAVPDKKLDKKISNFR